MTCDDLRNERERRELTQEEMSAFLGTPVSTYRKWEQGVRKVPVWVPERLVPQVVQIEKVSLAELAEMDNLARADGVTLDALLASFIREGLDRRKAAATAAAKKKQAAKKAPPHRR